MFGSQNKESATGQIDFVKESKKTMKAVVRFLYNGQVADYDVTLELLKAAHLFGLTVLKDECDRVLAQKRLSESTAFNKFIIAYTFSANALKKETGNFLIKHFGIEGLKKRIEWKNLKISHPDEVFDFLESRLSEK